MNFKKLQDLTIEDNFMFQKVMQDESICREFIEKLLNIRIKTITYPETEKTITMINKGKGIRLDVYVETDTGKMIDIEMQTSKINRELPKRTRYYQGMIDTNSLPKGESYRKLRELYIIFVCTFDPFKYSRMIYTFRNKCIEVADLELDDKVTKIFLNSSGIDGNINDDIKKLLKYINSGEVEGEFTNKVDDKLKELKSHEEIGVEYMTYEMLLDDVREDAYNEGLVEGRNAGTFFTELKNLKKLMQKMNMTIEEAMDFLETPKADRTKYLKALTD